MGQLRFPNLTIYRCILNVAVLAAICLAYTASTANAQGSQSHPVPVVRFQADSEAAALVAERCAEIWDTEGLTLSQQLLPYHTNVDTVTCLVLASDNFSRYFAGRLPDWGVGAALPNGRIIALDYTRISAVGRGLREIFLHEMVHALLFQGSANVWLPAWIHEGSAMLYSGEWKFSDTISLVLEGQVPDLYSLQGRFPTSAVFADRAYRTSLLAVQRLQDQHGKTVIGDILEQCSGDVDFEVAFSRVTGTTVESFSRGFSSAMRIRFGWLVMMTRWPTLFVLMAVGFAIGAVRKIVLKRRQLADMDEFEDDGAEI